VPGSPPVRTDLGALSIGYIMIVLLPQKLANYPVRTVFAESAGMAKGPGVVQAEEK
jgi:hypothetical protein